MPEYITFVDISRISHTFNVISTILLSFICIKTVKLLIDIRKPKWCYVLVLTGCSLLGNMIIFIGDFANIIPTLLIFIAVLIIGCDGSIQQKISVALVFCSCALAYNACLDNFIQSFKVRSICRFLFWILLYFALLKIVPSRRCILPSKIWTLIGILSLTPLGIVFTIILLGNRYYEVVELQQLVLLLIAVFAVIGLFWAIALMSKYRQLEEKQMYNQMNQNYYKGIENEHFEVRRLRHDMANHLSVLTALPNNKIRAYLNELLVKIEETQNFHFCSNATVNAVLATKSSLMEKNKITFDCEVALPEKIFVQEMDLCAVFSNSLDNAVEACVKLPVEKRIIHLHARAEKGLFMLQIENPFSEKIKKNGIRFQTIKKDQTQHGFGLRSINEIVDRYNGSMEIKTEDSVFSLLLYLPITT